MTNFEYCYYYAHQQSSLHRGQSCWHNFKSRLQTALFEVTYQLDQLTIYYCDGVSMQRCLQRRGSVQDFDSLTGRLQKHSALWRMLMQKKK